MNKSVLLETLSTGFRKARSVNATNTSFPSRVPTIAEPVGDAASATGASVIEAGGKDGVLSQNGLLLCPFGTGADDTTFSVRILGWRRIKGNYATPTVDVWIPVKLLELAVTLSTATGAAGGEVVVAERFADTLALVGTSGNDDVSMEIVSPADNTIAHAVVDIKGFQKIELTFDMTGATDGNALLAWL